MLRHIKGGGMNKKKETSERRPRLFHWELNYFVVPEGKLFCHILATNFIVFSRNRTCCFSRVVREAFLVYSVWSSTDNKCKCRA